GRPPNEAGPDRRADVAGGSFPFLGACGAIQRVDLRIQAGRVDGPVALDGGCTEPIPGGEFPLLLTSVRVHRIELAVEGAEVDGASRDSRRGDNCATDIESPALRDAAAFVAQGVEAPVGRSYENG